MVRKRFSDYVNNWANPEYTLAEKVRLTIKNNAIKLRNASSCCGNHGEPGC
jgi:hypothetical protein